MDATGGPAPAEVPTGAVPGGVPLPPRGRRFRQEARAFWAIMRANPLTLVGFVLVVLLALVAGLVVLVPAVTGLFGHSISLYPYDPINGFTTNRLQAPSSSHWLGTDDSGRDTFSRVLAALPVDLAIAFAITLFGVAVGGALGLVAGYWNEPWTVGGAVSSLILRLADIFLSVPTLLLSLAVVTVLGRGVWQPLVALMITWWPYYTRLVRGEVLSIKQQPFITAARAAGVGDFTIVRRHVLRNLLEPIVVYFTMDLGTVIVVFSTISFIANPLPASLPEWGRMTEGYVNYFPAYPWPIISVSLAIIVTVLAFSLLGDGLRDILDPRSRRVLAQAGAAGESER